MCSVEGCERKELCKSFCNMHYKRWKTHGDPLVVLQGGRKRKEKVPCSIPGCENFKWARTWCIKHYRRWRTTGDPESTLVPSPGSRTIEERFWSKVDRTATCWLWLGSKSSDGYGIFGIHSRKGVMAHRYSYELTHGSIPTDMEIDHVCHNEDTGCRASKNCIHRRCVNPEHLSLVRPEDHRASSWKDRRTRYV